MGLDLTLAVVILIAALRGWFQGFVSQAVRLGGIIACVYLAEPVRDYAKPNILPHLPSIQPELVDRLLWWVSAAVTYVVLVGGASLVIKMTRRPEIPGISQSGRNDQFAGFLLGAAKGVLVAAFAIAGVQKYALDQIKTVSWGEEQVKTSWALKWSDAYQPVPRIWSSPPVRHFVNYVERMGLSKPGEPSQVPAGLEDEGESPPVRTASRPTEGGSANEQGPSATSTPSPVEETPERSAVPAEKSVEELRSQSKEPK
jgi:uncharacterized membrane protein required for colicin V production